MRVPMYPLTDAQVCLWRPCYVARVSATLPLVEEGRLRPSYVARVGATLPLVEEGKLTPCYPTPDEVSPSGLTQMTTLPETHPRNLPLQYYQYTTRRVRQGEGVAAALTFCLHTRGVALSRTRHLRGRASQLAGRPCASNAEW